MRRATFGAGAASSGFFITRLAGAGFAAGLARMVVAFVALAAGAFVVRTAGLAAARAGLAAGFAAARVAGFLATVFFGAAFTIFFGAAALRAAGFAAAARVVVARTGALRAAGFFAAGAAFFATIVFRAPVVLAADLAPVFAGALAAALAGAFLVTTGLRAVEARAFGAARRVEARIASGCARVDELSSSFTKCTPCLPVRHLVFVGGWSLVVPGMSTLGCRQSRPDPSLVIQVWPYSAYHLATCMAG